MYDRILVPVDLSDSNAAVLRRATTLGDAETTRIVLVHVIETLDGLSPDEDGDFYDELRENAEAKLEPWAADVADAGFEVSVEIAYGKRGQELVRLSDDADLVVLRSHVVDPDDEDARTRMGTLSHQVALFASCSVLLVRE